ncbi:MAG: hypothetical protein WC003_14675 [Terrimicrobiaceae bacterium]|jgi:hypothetical protein
MHINRVFLAAEELQECLLSEGFLFCFIGGLAVQRWGEPRMTRDADATILTNFTEDDRAIAFLLGKFLPRRPDAGEFARRNRVLLIRASNGVDMDVALGAIDFEQRSVSRATEWEHRKDHSIKTCSAGDLVVHKAFASRERDWLDVDGICARQGTKLDRALILAELEPLAALKDDPDIIPRLRRTFSRHGIA